ncbi:unnamed protein product [Arabis nemorensis]|uniref:Uncharacterized protein n=1 Tax=Arabis nemorensis TaxID=586526 RepID=A0A565CQ13_9BRAS|nr:unnamed protein product [Arabis nemorensis]
MTKELKKIDESVDILEDAIAAEAEVNKPSNDVGSSNWTTMQPYELWEQAKVIGAGTYG